MNEAQTHATGPDIVFGEYQPRRIPSDSVTLYAPQVMGALRRVEAYAALLGVTIQDDLTRGRQLGTYTYCTRAARLKPGLAPLMSLHLLLQVITHARLHHDFYDRHQAALEAEACATEVCAQLGFDASPGALGYVPSWTHDPRKLDRGKRFAVELAAALRWGPFGQSA